MRARKRHSPIFALGTLFVFMGFTAAPALGEFYGTAPTGLIQLEAKHSCYLFVPRDYSPEKTWPLLFLVGKRGEDPKKLIGSWQDWASENHFLVLATLNMATEKEVPRPVDSWLLKIKQEVEERYRIDASRILLVGTEFGAHYASYLALHYSEEFAGAALVRGAWTGPLAAMIEPDPKQEKKIPFYVALDPKGDHFQQDELKSAEFERAGYRITLEKIKEGEDLSHLQEKITQWFRQTSEAEGLVGTRPRKKIFRRMMENLFED